MPEFIKVAQVGDLNPGDMKLVEVKDQSILLANVSGRFYAIGDVCTHAECSLSEGTLEGAEIECPCHGSRYNITTGKVVQGPAEEDEPRYEVRITGKDISLGPF